jgi:predicted ATPase
MGESLRPVGELTQARAWLERALAAGADRKDTTDLRYSHDHGVTALLFLASTLLILGHPDSAQRAMADAVARADALGHPPTLGMVLWAVGMLALLRRDAADTADLSARAVAQCAEHGVTMFGDWAAFCLGWGVFRRGDATRGVSAMRTALAHADRAHAVLYRPIHLGYLAEACASAGEPGEGFRLLDEAIDLAERTGERVFEAELHRLRGDLLVGAKRAHDAEAAWQQALAVARRQSAKLWELRAATSLARFWAEQGERRKAHDLLAPIHAWFTEGLETADLLAARSVLGSLS